MGKVDQGSSIAYGSLWRGGKETAVRRETLGGDLKKDEETRSKKPGSHIELENTEMEGLKPTSLWPHPIPNLSCSSSEDGEPMDHPTALSVHSLATQAKVTPTSSIVAHLCSCKGIGHEKHTRYLVKELFPDT